MRPILCGASRRLHKTRTNASCPSACATPMRTRLVERRAACGVRVYALPLRLAQAVAVHVDSDTRTLQGPRKFGRVLNHTELQSLNERAARIMYRLREHA